jgi:hypothetical protein
MASRARVRVLRFRRKRLRSWGVLSHSPLPKSSSPPSAANKERDSGVGGDVSVGAAGGSGGSGSGSGSEEGGGGVGKC